MRLAHELKLPVGIIETALSEAPIQSWIDYRTTFQSPDFVRKLKERKLWVNSASWQGKSPRSLAQPGVLFNHKIAPLRGMCVRGFIFSDGEHEVGHQDFFAEAFKLRIQSWQRVFRPVPGEQLHLLYTSLAPVIYEENKLRCCPALICVSQNAKKLTAAFFFCCVARLTSGMGNESRTMETPLCPAGSVLPVSAWPI